MLFMVHRSVVMGGHCRGGGLHQDHHATADWFFKLRC